MRSEASTACLSWIPPTAVEGAFRLPFGLGIAHYDQPPADAAPDIDALLAADAIRFANQLHAWIETDSGRIVNHGMSGGGRLGSTTVRLGSHGLTFAGVALPDLTAPPEVETDRVHFTQTAGGHTGIAVPRRVSHPPFWRLTAPVAWSTITLTLRADGSSEAHLTDASPFPRHYLYDPAGQLTHKSALLRYHDWIRESGRHATPWDVVAGPIPVAPVNTERERSLANSILMSRDYRQHRLPADAFLSDLPITCTQVHLLLDGLLVIEIDHQPAAEAGPGAIFDPALRTQDSKEHVTVRARTPCRLAVVPRGRLDDQALLGAAAAQKSRFRAVHGAAAQDAAQA
jgi:CRP-like cAMP-binding protein